MPTAKPTKVYPVPGVFVPGEPAIVHEVDTKAEADRLVATGAFTLTQAEANELSPTGGAPSEPPATADDKEPA